VETLLASCEGIYETSAESLVSDSEAAHRRPILLGYLRPSRRTVLQYLRMYCRFGESSSAKQGSCASNQKQALDGSLFEEFISEIRHDKAFSRVVISRF
jgi:hypothetical protein